MKRAIACLCVGFAMSISAYLLHLDLPYIALAFAAGFTFYMEVSRGN
jgi:hypothetical protein